MRIANPLCKVSALVQGVSRKPNTKTDKSDCIKRFKYR
jgi:hypothetical protein